MSKAEQTQQQAAMRCVLYSPDCLEGRIFAGADAIDAAQEDGWVDTPGEAQQMLDDQRQEEANANGKDQGTAAKPKTGGKKATKDDDSK